MTRTHVEEGELVELQRKALALYQNVNLIAAASRPGICPGIGHAASLAREVSDQVDALTDYVRNKNEPIRCGKWDCPE